jgi:hypothetical protein
MTQYPGREYRQRTEPPVNHPNAVPRPLPKEGKNPFSCEACVESYPVNKIRQIQLDRASAADSAG